MKSIVGPTTFRPLRKLRATDTDHLSAFPDWDTPILLRFSNNPLRFTARALLWLLASILQGVERTGLGLGLRLAKPNKPGSKRSAVVWTR